MAKVYDNQLEPDYAILVGVGVNETINDTSLDELCALCETCNIMTVRRVIQNRKDIDVTYYIGKGKVEEIANILNAESDKDDTLYQQPTVVVFDVELSGSKVRNLEKEWGVPVLDRSKVILDIFARRAQSAEGKLQVELAQLKYNLPRLIGSEGLMAKMRNSVGMRGPGEKKLELDKRTIRDEISLLETKLKKLRENRTLNKHKATKSGKPRVCLVGYTNSGKSTLLNTISKTNAVAEDKLFATLDPKTANVYLERKSGNIDYSKGGQHGLQILLTDTVGFINKLPHEFIKAFESTLDEARYADLLLHVVDISNPDYSQQIDVVNDVLKKIDADKIPTIMVYNKIDKMNNFKQLKDSDIRDIVYISARENKGIEKLKERIITKL